MMRWFPSLLCALYVMGHHVTSVPVPEVQPETLEDQEAQMPWDLQERLRSLQLDESTLEQVTRDKRTIAVLRQLFPGLSQIIDRKLARITQYLFRVIGRAVLRSGLGGGGGGGGNSTRRVIVTLPTFPPDPEDDDADDDSERDAANTTDAGAAEASTLPASETELNPEDENQLSSAESQHNEVRVKFPDEDVDDDQDAAATGDNAAPDPAHADAASDEEADRDKRLINFSVGGGVNAGGSGAGSGNFLFDIIRRTADTAARAAGTVYRVVAGTENLASAVTTTTTSNNNNNNNNQTTTMMTNNGTTRVLVAGSGNTESNDGVGVGVTADVAVHKDDGYQAGIPGPLTRLFVIANRGIANLLQDLILRLAQTSEKIVNFKARLITSII